MNMDFCISYTAYNLGIGKWLTYLPKLNIPYHVNGKYFKLQKICHSN